MVLLLVGVLKPMDFFKSSCLVVRARSHKCGASITSGFRTAVKDNEYPTATFDCVGW